MQKVWKFIEGTTYIYICIYICIYISSNIPWETVSPGQIILMLIWPQWLFQDVLLLTKSTLMILAPLPYILKPTLFPNKKFGNLLNAPRIYISKFFPHTDPPEHLQQSLIDYLINWQRTVTFIGGLFRVL